MNWAVQLRGVLARAGLREPADFGPLFDEPVGGHAAALDLVHRFAA